MDPALLREWGPLLKPSGLGLLAALHSFEEPTPGHPYYGWAHCTQIALAAYLDTSQDTIARYTSLLHICGLVQIEEVETARGKQKLYRVARGLPLPSVALLEHLIFDADAWTRKHTAWLTAPLAPLGPATELTRLTAILHRAYRVALDKRGLAEIAAGARLTPAGSYTRRRDPAAYQPDLLPAGPSAPGGQVPAPAAPLSAAGSPHEADQSELDTPTTSAPQSFAVVSPLLPCRERGSGGEGGDSPQDSACYGYPADSLPTSDRAAPEESARCGLGAIAVSESAWCGLGEEIRAARAVWESAPGGLGPDKISPNSGDSAESGVGETIESAESGVPRPINDNVESIRINDNKNGYVNDAPAFPAESASSGEELSTAEGEALVRWGAVAVGDQASLDWHRRCLAEHGAARYRWAIESTRRAQARSKVGRPGAYFTSLLRRGKGPTVPATVGQGSAPGCWNKETAQRQSPVPPPPVLPTSDPTVQGQIPVLQPPVLSIGDTPAPDSTPPDALRLPGLPAVECGRLWQTALLHLRYSLSPDEYSRTLRYAVLLELDPTTGWALLGLPTDYMREQVAQRLAAPIAAVLSGLCGAGVRVVAVVLPGQGHLGGAMPTLGALLAGGLLRSA